MKKRWIWGVVLGGMLVASGMLLERLRTGGGSPESGGAQIAALEEQNRRLSDQLDRALPDAAQWRAAVAEDRFRTPVSDAEGSGVSEEPVVRDAEVIRRELVAALGERDGRRWLALLSELSALGEEHEAEVAGQWVRLVNMTAGELDGLGLSRIDLTVALAAEADLIRFALHESGLDPTFRQFTADTLAQAGFEFRRGILSGLEFSTEKDPRVVSALVRAAQDIRDPAFVDRFLHLVQRTDLSNGMRHNVAFMIARIDGQEAAGALDVLRESGSYQRIVPVLQSIHSPPATGLLVVNGLPAEDGRIGHNDILLEYNGRPIRTRADVTLADATTSPGDMVPVRVFRDGGELVMYVTVTATVPGHLHFEGQPVVKKGR